MITEFISVGSLKQNLKRIKQPLLCLIKKWITEILRGLDYVSLAKGGTIIIYDDNLGNFCLIMLC